MTFLPSSVESEAALVLRAHETEKGERELREYLRPLVKEIVARYSTAGVPRVVLEEQGWKDFHLARRNFMVHATEADNTMLFSAYFNWYVRNAIEGYLDQRRPERRQE